jgi:hypothetical protein
MKKLRLVKVVVHPVFLVDDGENLIPLENYLRDSEGNPANLTAEILAKDWPTYATDAFVENVKALEAQITAADSDTKS